MKIRKKGILNDQELIQNSLTKYYYTKVSQKFCNILVHATLLHIYQVTKADQTIKGTSCGLWYYGSWCTNTCFASLFGLIFWHINHCWLFNAKFCFYIYIKYIWFENTFCRYTVKWSVLLLTIQFSISQQSQRVPSIAMNNNSIKHQSFLYTQLNDQTVLYLTIQYNISYLLALSLNVKQFYFTHRYDTFRCYHSKSEWTREWWHWRGTLHSPKLEHHHQIVQCYIQDTHWRRSLIPLQRCSRCILQPLLIWAAWLCV